MALYDIIKFDGIQNKEWLLYKFNQTQFNVNSKLIVSPGQIALIVHNGKLEKLVKEGTFKLNSEFLPFFKGITNLVHGGKNAYPFEIYFINKKIKLDLLWGTADPINILDPTYKINLNIRARGQFGVKLIEYASFFENLVGTLINGNYITFDIINKYFKGVLNQRIRETISTYIIKNKVTYFELQSHLDEIKAVFAETTSVEFKKLGFELYNLSIESITVPEENLKKLNDILYKKAEFEQLGEQQYRTIRGYDVLEKGASNRGNNAGSMIGMGIGMNLVGQMQGGNIIPKQPAQETSTCKNCNFKMAKGSKFCPECGEKTKNLCPECNSEISSKTKFCPECGTKLGGK